MASLVSGAGPVEEAEATACGSWQAAIAGAVTDPGQLCRLLDLPEPTAGARRASEGFSLLVPQPYLGRIRPGDPRDPLLLQVLPQNEELADCPQFTTDPVAEQQTGVFWDRPTLPTTASPRCPTVSEGARPSAGACRGLLCKYPNRALMVTTAACGVHCRFCFRRHFPYQALPKRADDWEPAIERIASEASIREVILSGGDPLALDDPTLRSLARRLAHIRHLTRLRIHTRMPIVIPDRVTDELLDWLRGTRLSPVVVVHVNHAQEIDGPVAAALSRLVDAGVPVLAQTVLLRGVNDRVGVLAELFERLADHRVMPYYVHQLDRVAGAAHFEVPEPTGRRLFAELRARLPGYIVPRYVREVPGEPSKRVLA